MKQLHTTMDKEGTMIETIDWKRLTTVLGLFLAFFFLVTVPWIYGWVRLILKIMGQE